MPPEVAPSNPVTADGPTVFLLQADTDVERELLERWVAEHGQAQGTRSEAVVLGPDDGPPLRALLDREDDPVLVPTRVAWRPKERDGERSARLRDRSEEHTSELQSRQY